MIFKMNITENALKELLLKQLRFFSFEQNAEDIDSILMETIQRIEYCFSKNTNKYFRDGNITCFSPFNSAQYGIFLYYLSNSAFHAHNMELAEKAYYLNKMLHSVDWFYEIELPKIFMADHPMGTVLGRAKYANFFCVSQGCTVGNNHGIYPVIGERVVMHPNSIVVGNSKIGNNVEISANTFIKDEDVLSNCLVFGSSPHLTIVTKTENEMKERLTQFDY